MKRKKNYSRVGMQIAAARARLASRKAPKRRKRKAHRKSRRIIGGVKHRPVVYVKRGRLFRGRRSKVFGNRFPAKVNGRHRRRSFRRRHNPMGSLRSLMQLSTLFRLLKGGLGFLLGMQITSLIGAGSFMGKQLFTPPEWFGKARPVYGLLVSGLGLWAMSKVRNPHGRDIAAGVIAYGGFDFTVQLLGMAGIDVPMLSGPIDFGEAITTAPGTRTAIVGNADEMEEVDRVLSTAIA